MSQQPAIRYDFEQRSYVNPSTGKLVHHHIVKDEPIRYTYIPSDFHANRPAKVIQEDIQGISKQTTTTQVQAVKHEPVRVPYVQTQPVEPHQKKLIQERTRFPCDQCDYAAATNSYLQKHKKVKHEGIRFPYVQSDYAIASHSFLTQNKKLKPCDQCDYVATKTSSLKHHRRSKHEGIVFPCDECEYSATTSSNLTKHKMSKHEGIRFNCDKCEYAATLPSDLTKHVRNKHDGIKYPCEHCDFASTTTSSLRQHIRYKHEGVRFHCDQCDYAATTSSNLTKHKLSTNCVLRKCDLKNKTYRNSIPIPAPILMPTQARKSEAEPQEKMEVSRSPLDVVGNAHNNLPITIHNSQIGSHNLAISPGNNVILHADSVNNVASTVSINVVNDLSSTQPNNLSLNLGHLQHMKP